MSDMDTEYWAPRHLAVLNAIKNWPALPSPLVLKELADAARYPDDHGKGKEMQRELGLERIPPVSECEGGAGVWDRITQGAWRETEEDRRPA